MLKQRVGLLFGGRSGEHEVSIASARAIASALTSEDNVSKYELWPVYIQKDGIWQAGEIARQVLESGKVQIIVSDRTIWQFPPEVEQVDVWFPIIHGPNGEDGTVQGLLKLMQVPFVGTGVLGSAVGMDKIAMKVALGYAGLPQVNYMSVNRSEVWSNPESLPKLCDNIEANLGYPCFVKPANSGSSVGIGKAQSRSQLEAALDNAASYNRRIIVEAAVQGRELECAVLGNYPAKVSVVGEITYQSEFYDYETKYTVGKAELLIPAPVSETIIERVQDMALQAFAAIDGAGLTRVDFFYIEATGNLVINEVNTLPGFTATSMYPQLWASSGISFPELVDNLIQLALQRHDSSMRLA